MDRELNKDEIKFLKIIGKNKLKFNNENTNINFIKEILFHDYKKYLKHINIDNIDYDYLYNNYFYYDYEFVGQKDKIIKLAPKGQSILDKVNKEINPKLKFWLPTGISIVALAVSIVALVK